MYQEKNIQIDNENKDSKKPKNSEKFITIFTDGSYCPDTGAWGCGIWMKNGSNKSQTYKFGGLEGKNSTEVELKALEYIVENILNKTNHVKGKIIVIQCDNISAMEKFNYYPLKKLGADFVKMKHVRSHKSNKNSRTYVNNLVDKLARNQMNKYRYSK